MNEDKIENDDGLRCDEGDYCVSLRSVVDSDDD